MVNESYRGYQIVYGGLLLAPSLRPYEKIAVITPAETVYSDGFNSVEHAKEAIDLLIAGEI